jgi:polysaccharide biosynthesis transport protein
MADLEAEPADNLNALQIPVRRLDCLPSPQLSNSIGWEHSQDSDAVNLLDYWRVLVKRRWTIIATMLLVTAIAAIFTWRATPVYRSRIKLQIDPEHMNLLPIKEGMDAVSNYAQSQEYLQTQIKILASKSLADRVIRTLYLENNPAFLREQSKHKGVIIGWIRSLFASPVADGNDLKTQYSKYAERFLDDLSVSPIRNSRLVEASYDSRDPNLSATVLNTLAEEYIELNFQTKFDAAQKASSFLARQSADLKSRLEKAEEGLVQFSREHDIYAIGEKDDVVLQKLSDLNSALTAAQAERIQKESIWKIVQAANPGTFPTALRNGLIKDLETNVANLRVTLAKLNASFKPGWPEYDQVKDQLSEAERQLAIEQQKAIKNVETEYWTAVTREELLSGALQTQKGEAGNLNQNSIQYKILKHQVDSDKQLYEGLLQRMKEAEVSAGLKSSTIHVVDFAEPSRQPSSPNRPLNIGLGLIVGLLLGMGVAFSAEHLDSSFKTPNDVDQYLSLPFLGVIPTHQSMQLASRHRRSTTRRLISDGNSFLLEMVTHYASRSPISEAYRNLRTSVLLSSPDGKMPQILAVTSSREGEGKTTICMNMSVTLAQAGENVLLLDCDMRNPKLHRALKLSPEMGISTYLSGESELMPLIQRTEVPNLYAISAGKIPSNPAELIGSPRMREGLELLAGFFHHIIIDTPPVLSVTDARVLGTLVDGVILVVKSGTTPREAVRLTKRMLLDVRGHILGVVLNNVDLRSADYAYYSKYYYYGYGRYSRTA